MLLQASTRERRTVFEEAAGISRFKARKTETLPLERVQHLNASRTFLTSLTSNCAASASRRPRPGVIRNTATVSKDALAGAARSHDLAGRLPRPALY